MPTEAVTYPDVTVHLSTHPVGNVVFVIDAIAKQIRCTVGDEAADKFMHNAMNCASYVDLLALVQRTVYIT